MTNVVKYELSDLDKTGFLKEVTVAIFFEIPPKTNVEKIISSLEDGLKNTIDQLPFMAGELQFQDTGKLCIVKAPENELKLDIQRLASSDSPSLSDLAQGSFAPESLDLSRFLPHSAQGKKPVCALKWSLIEGGLVLGVRINHAAGDWASIDRFLSLICESCKAHQEGLKMPVYTPELDRDPYNIPTDLSQHSREKALGNLPIFYVMDKSDFKPPSLTPSQPKIYRISEEASKAVKERCAPLLKQINLVEFVSSYDCISALLWTSITRARLELDSKKLDSPSRFIHPIDVRTRDPHHKTSTQYFGNAVIGTEAGPINAQDMVSGEDLGLATAASLVRKSINAVDLSSISHMTYLMSSLGPTETLGSRADFTNMDIFMNTWQSGNTDKYELGAGVVPVAFRVHLPAPGACAVILPNFSRGAGGAFDVHLQVLAEEHELLQKDAEFMKYFELVG